MNDPKTFSPELFQTLGTDFSSRKFEFFNRYFTYLTRLSYICTGVFFAFLIIFFITLAAGAPFGVYISFLIIAYSILVISLFYILYNYYTIKNIRKSTENSTNFDELVVEMKKQYFSWRVFNWICQKWKQTNIPLPSVDTTTSTASLTGSTESPEIPAV